MEVTSVKLRKQPRGKRAEETVIAEGRAEPSAPESVFWDHDRSQPQGPNAMLLTLKGSGGTRYVLEVDSAEVGVFLGEMNLPDVAPVMAAFLAGASPEVIGAVVGHIVTHLARSARKPPD
jgi:hypothetical protein